MRLLNLSNLSNIKENKNEAVLSLNDAKIEDDFTFCDEYGGLCGGVTEGLLLEESQEELFALSDIDWDYVDEKKVRLMQDGKVYEANIVIGTEGTCTPSEHIDFNSLIEVQ